MPDPIDQLKSSLAGRYRFERELGAGGMASVYLARDLKHDRDVAIKVVRPELSATTCRSWIPPIAAAPSSTFSPTACPLRREVQIAVPAR